MLSYEFMRLALAAAVLVGLTAPTVGVYLVQRRLSLIGDGLGHVALLGVAVGLATRSAPVLTALLATVAGAVVVEVLRARRSTGTDVALAIMFYGGLAGGVVVVTRAPAGTPITLDSYLFGALTTTTRADLVVFAGMAAVVLGVTIGLGRSLFTVALDEEHARASGLPVLGLNLLLAVVTAVTVTLSMRVLGLLLISGLMVLPAGCAQLVARSFRSSLVIAALIGVTVSVSGTAVSFYADTPSGGTIVLMAVAVYAVLSVARLAHRGSLQHGPDVVPTPVRPVDRPDKVPLPR
ncbi:MULTISPECIES: metal ABC transporter permease [unclassified Modestobacter]|uniref:metal ABC transporter permease n=1 Tax=unclassified Modestobacter TaxID=2643866 RepID=UPI0022AAA6CA|nr:MULTISPECIES: metal ABC transporter permease [unclassified Modestobacter]MCZ2826443.1 metal ABC transporter permease [Modestobacter sp. VKM Ac-2981]MCZ2852492.1 metal ABC transporter permease [Modestobacter sp. VKM Ac-2982]